VPTASFQTALNLLGQAGQQVLHRLLPKRFIGRAAAEQRAALLEAARTYERLLEVYFFSNETLPALYAAIRSLNLAEAAGPSPELARAYATMGTIMGFIPLHGLAHAYCGRGLEMVRPLNNLAARAWVSLTAGFYYAGLGRWDLAGDLFEKVIALSQRLGDSRRSDDAVENLVLVHYFEGKFAQAEALTEDLYASASRRGDADNQAWGLAEKGYCALALGKLEVAEACVEGLRGLFGVDSKIVDDMLKVDVYGLFALARLRLGQTALARKTADEAAQLIARSSLTGYPALLGYASVAEVYLELWAEEMKSQSSTAKPQLQTAAQRALKALHKFAGVFPIGQAFASLWQGRYEWQAGRPGPAQQAWRKAIEQAEKLMMPYPAALAHEALGSHAASEAERASHRERARVLLAQLSAPAEAL
jgi:tetratricopeptide (TPR) repeat protein